jgi:mono/diheme cytochrome c family protein
MKAMPAVLGLWVLLAALPAGLLAAQPTISWTWKSVSAATDPGKAEFERACTVCHGDGPDRPGTSSLQIKYQGKLPALLEERADLKPEFVRLYVRNGFAMMPRFRKTELDDAQVEAIVRYLTRAR